MNSWRILIVDDQENWREVMRSLLIDGGYGVDTAASVSEAWELLNTKRFDIAILDVRLVDRNPYDVQGVELLEQMKERLGERFPVVIMTGYTFEGLEEIMRTRYGVREFINKGTGRLQDISAFRDLIASILKDTVSSHLPPAQLDQLTPQKL
jgi:DNA-binding NtrC family response regulator